ncbi:MAG: hypothetical protein IPM82_11300 [Saprospiraceae bacterium]|nr:hypothetical protein [Saprospiraceae bacterium]
MKKVIFKNGFRAFWAAALLLVLGVVSAQAQSLSTTAPGGANQQGSTFSVAGGLPQGNFVSNSQALTLLDAALVDLKVQMVNSGMDPNDPIFLAILAKYKYFGKIRENVEIGFNPASAIIQGLLVFSQDAELYYVTPAAQEQLKLEAIDLLS